MPINKKEIVCGCLSNRADEIKRIKQKLFFTEEISHLFKALGDETRIKIVYALAQGELCVHDAAQVIDSSVATASYHLRLLKNMGLARSRRQGKMIFYALDDPCVQIIIGTALEHFRHRENKT